MMLPDLVTAVKARRPGSRLLALLIVIAVAAGCDTSSKAKQSPAQTPPKQASTKPSASLPTQAAKTKLPSFDKSSFPAAERLVAIGDLHGDLEATRQVLRLAGALGNEDEWVGGQLVVVQTGDQLDRGDHERGILDLLLKLKEQAKQAGGRLVVLNGNHETMNVSGDFRYVTPGGFADFQSSSSRHLPAGVLGQLPEHAHARAGAFFPGGDYAKQLASHPVIAKVGDSVFAHGGVLYKHVRYGIDRMNREVGQWFLGKGEPPRAILTPEAPVWTRLYSEDNPTAAACAELAQVLNAMNAKRMVVGHTVQHGGITSACDERVWRIDVGMSAHYRGDSVQALEIQGGHAKILTKKKVER